MNTNERKIIKTPYYYVIKVTVGKTGKTFYKIGETTTNTKRPDSLVNKYEQYRTNSACRLLFEPLPVLKDKRLNDKQIHSALLKTGKFTRANEFEVQVMLNEKDGKHEFFETSLTETEVINEITSAVAGLSLNKINYTAKVNYYLNCTLNFDPAKKHLVNNHLISAIFKKFPTAKKVLYDNNADDVILLIGQFLPEFVASFAMHNKVIIWHDTNDQKYIYEYEELNKNITYIETLEELINMDTKFDLIIANPPYGKVGANITKNIIDNVEFDEYINLLPLKDMPSAGLEVCSHIDIPNTFVCPPHSFSDADILTHILKITKEPNKNYASFEELCADSYFIDKPMAKFMKANILAEHYAISNIKKFKAGLSVERTFVFHHFDTGSAHTCGLPKIDSDIPKNNYNFKGVDESTNGRLYGVDKALVFNTEMEKQNFINFIVNNRNFINRMIANQFIALRNTAACFPKVDWTRADWTIETILKDVADYTDAEVNEVLATMDKDYAVKKDACIDRLFGEYL